MKFLVKAKGTYINQAKGYGFSADDIEFVQELTPELEEKIANKIADNLEANNDVYRLDGYDLVIKAVKEVFKELKERVVRENSVVSERELRK